MLLEQPQCPFLHMSLRFLSRLENQCSSSGVYCSTLPHGPHFIITLGVHCNVNLAIGLQGFPGRASGKELACYMQEMKETRVRALSWEEPLEEGMATHFSILAWRIPLRISLPSWRSLECYNPKGCK